MITNFRYANAIILLAILEAELQELVDRVSRKYSLLDKTKVMASDGIACRILIQNELVPVSLITEDDEYMTEFRSRVSLQKIWKISISMKI